MRRVSAQELSEALRGSRSALLIVDVRDEDFTGGNIPGAVNIPSASLHRHWPRLHSLAKDKHLVVFHCMKSQVRGPAAAQQYVAYLSRLQDGGDAAAASASASAAVSAASPTPSVAVLESGFQGWLWHLQSRHRQGEDVSQLIEAYNARTWGYPLLKLEAANAAAAADHRAAETASDTDK